MNFDERRLARQRLPGGVHTLGGQTNSDAETTNLSDGGRTSALRRGSESETSESDLSSDMTSSSESESSSNEESDDPETLAEPSEEDGSDGSRDSEPRPKRIRSSESTIDLGTRLISFLPQLKQANAKLSDLPAAQIDNVAEDEERYIEMDLSLGILQETARHDNDITLKYTSSDSTRGDDGTITQEVIETLKGQRATRSGKRKIEELA